MMQFGSCLMHAVLQHLNLSLERRLTGTTEILSTIADRISSKERHELMFGGGVLVS